MSNGDESETPADAEIDDSGEPAETEYDLDEATFEQRLDDAEAAIEAADTEADLDAVESTLESIDADLEAAELPEPEDEDEEAPQDALESRLADLREQLEDARGPYASDVLEHVEEPQSTIRETEWTETGHSDIQTAVSDFLGRVNDEIGAGLTTEHDADPATLADALDPAIEAIESAGLDPDEDAETIDELLEAATTLTEDVEDAEAYDDLSVREKLQTEGFYDVLGTKHKDFPPEWSALKEWEQRDDPEMVMLLMELMGGQEHMERHCLDALERMGNDAVVSAMAERAEKRDKRAITILGKIGHEEPLETLHDYADADPQLQRITLKALGEIGSEDSTQHVANQLVADTDSVRSQAARALGLIGDPRAIDPLTGVLEDEEEADTVRASAAWALTQIGTEAALERAAEYADDRSYIVSVEAEHASGTLQTTPKA